MMERYVLVSVNDVIKSCYERSEEISVNLPLNCREFRYLGEGIALNNHKAIFNEDKTSVVNFGEYVEPKSPEPLQPNELEILGQEVTSLKISNIQKDIIINNIGQELTNIKLKLLQGGM